VIKFGYVDQRDNFIIAQIMLRWSCYVVNSILTSRAVK